MVRRFNIEIKNLKQVKQFLKDKNEEALNLVHKGLMNGAFNVEAEVKASILGQRAEPRSFDFGHLASSPKSQELSLLQVRVYSPIEYAWYIEHGHKLRDGSWWEGRHHFENTADREKGKVNKFIAEQLQKL
jgi:hypothetical protein